ncbi:hypothetical protein BKA70DRAFT_1225384 [Coprinopsis sp. MPI-PUGE-AT-0042]|nr:hypothetical protein BKA70DRAFT_1225384 [Coprinopsis sp. MPI-PUGE-AT-0042]
MSGSDSSRRRRARSTGSRSRAVISVSGGLASIRAPGRPPPRRYIVTVHEGTHGQRRSFRVTMNTSISAIQDHCVERFGFYSPVSVSYHGRTAESYDTPESLGMGRGGLAVPLEAQTNPAFQISHARCVFRKLIQDTAKLPKVTMTDSKSFWVLNGGESNHTFRIAKEQMYSSTAPTCKTHLPFWGATQYKRSIVDPPGPLAQSNVNILLAKSTGS